MDWRWYVLTAEIRRRRIVVPTLPVIERLALACRARARREAYTVLSTDLTPEQRSKLDGLLDSRGNRGRRISAGYGSRWERPIQRISFPAWSA
jgi:hypothetical protein